MGIKFTHGLFKSGSADLVNFHCWGKKTDFSVNAAMLIFQIIEKFTIVGKQKALRKGHVGRLSPINIIYSRTSKMELLQKYLTAKSY